MENMLNLQNKTSIKPSKSNADDNASAGILKYLVEIASRLTELKTGMENNIGSWQGLPESPELIAEHIHETVSLGMEIERLKKELSEKYTKARELRRNKKVFIDTLEKRAVGIHAHQQNSLTDYGIKYKTK